MFRQREGDFQLNLSTRRLPAERDCGQAFCKEGSSKVISVGYCIEEAIRYTHKKTGAPKILSLGEFFFVKGRTCRQTVYSAVTSFG